MLLRSRLVFRHGPSMGVCVAIHSSASPDHVVGYLTSVSVPPPPPPDLQAVVCPDPDFMDVTALTPDGVAFLALMRGV